MLFAQWILSSEAAFAAGIVAFLLLLTVDLISAPACAIPGDELPEGGEAARHRSAATVLPRR